MRKAKITLAILFLLSLFIPSQLAHADIAPPPAPGLGGLRPFQYQSTEVQMVYERVEMTVNALSPPNEYRVEDIVDVTAWFVLHNTSSKDEEMKVAFPLSSLTLCAENNDAPRSFGVSSSFVIPESFKVSRDGIELPIQITEIAGIDCIGWATFDVKFPAQKDVLIKVNYSMQTQGSGHDLILEYILETGAGWKGPIKQAYIVFKLPYLVTSDNIDTGQTTPGYQAVYNEILWSYRNLEPTPNDNIIVAFFEPRAWANIKTMENWLERNPADIDTWLKLIDEYTLGEPYNTGIDTVFNKAIKANPNNPDLYSEFAETRLYHCCYHLYPTESGLPEDGREYAMKHIIPLIDHSLALDPKNETALSVLKEIKLAYPDITYTLPTTIPPTVTSLFTETPSVMPSVTITPFPSKTPIVVTVVHTKIVEAPTSTPVPSPTMVSSPTQTESPVEEKPNTPNFIFGGLVIFAVGIGAGVFLSNRKRK